MALRAEAVTVRVSEAVSPEAGSVPVMLILPTATPVHCAVTTPLPLTAGAPTVATLVEELTIVIAEGSVGAT